MPSSRGSSRPRARTCVSYISCIGRWGLHTSTTWEAHLLRTHYFMNLLESGHFLTLQAF